MGLCQVPMAKEIMTAKGVYDKRKLMGVTSRRRDCHFADIPSPSTLKHLLKGEGVQQNDSLADG